MNQSLKKKTMIQDCQRWVNEEPLERFSTFEFQSLCQDCLEKLQSAYEFKFRCDENKAFLCNYLKECADSKLAEERAAKEAALIALDLDIDNLDSLPDKLVLKQVKKEKRPRKPRDPSKPAIKRRRRIPEKNIIIAEDSQIETAAYMRKIVTTPEQSPEQKHSSKRKSKHVVIEDVMIGEKATKKPAAVLKEEKVKEVEVEEEQEREEAPPKELPTKEKKMTVRGDDEPIFEDDDDFEEEPLKKKSKRVKKWNFQLNNFKLLFIFPFTLSLMHNFHPTFSPLIFRGKLGNEIFTC